MIVGDMGIIIWGMRKGWTGKITHITKNGRWVYVRFGFSNIRVFHTHIERLGGE